MFNLHKKLMSRCLAFDMHFHSSKIRERPQSSPSGAAYTESAMTYMNELKKTMLLAVIQETLCALFLQPEGEDDLKKRQLMELAIINGTYRDTKTAAAASPPGNLANANSRKSTWFP